MTVRLKFEAIRRRTISFWAALVMAFFLGWAYLVTTAYGVWNENPVLFQNAGAIGVALVIVIFAIKSQFDSRKLSLQYFMSMTAVADMMAARRKAGVYHHGEETFEQAALTAQTSLGLLDDYHTNSENWLLFEVCLLVAFTLQWGFGSLIIGLR